MQHNHTVRLPYGVSICFVLAIKPKICTEFGHRYITRYMLFNICGHSVRLARLHIFGFI
jgi:hypothetical protein